MARCSRGPDCFWAEGELGGLIDPNEPWDLDHRDDRRGWLGPSHRRCNRASRRNAKPRRYSRAW